MLWEKIFPCVFSALVGQKTPCFRLLFVRYCAILSWLNQLCVRWIVQRNKRGLAQTLLFSDNQAAVLQLPEDPRGALAAAVEFGSRLFQGKVQPNRAVRLDVAVLPGNACSVQQQRIEYLGVVADAPQGFVLEKEPRQWYIGRRWALHRELAKSFHLTSYPIHPIMCIDWIDRLILLYLDLFLIIAVFKIKAHIHMNETTLNSQKGKHSERRVESHWEEHPVTLP